MLATTVLSALKETLLSSINAVDAHRRPNSTRSPRLDFCGVLRDALRAKR